MTVLIAHLTQPPRIVSFALRQLSVALMLALAIAAAALLLSALGGGLPAQPHSI